MNGNGRAARPEILAPAGNAECLRFAVMYGADAVYLSGQCFGMRAGADNFSDEELAGAIDFVHKSGKRVYIACNTVARSCELEPLSRFMHGAGELGADAFIISDLGVFDLAKKNAPKVPVHISTQTGVANYATANMLHELGAQRVVLARELALEEVAEIRAKTPRSLEIEAFVHGSMCVSFSGRCLLSNYMTGRDANRGECAQPCRWSYSLMEEKRQGEYFPVFEDDRGTHILNSRDMCMIDHLPELYEAGVTSFKIEGRAKSFYYVAVTTNAYRMAAEEYQRHLLSGSKEAFILPEWIRREVETVSHREYSTGFYLGNAPGQVYNNGGYIREYEIAAIAVDHSDGVLTVSQRNRFFAGDTLEAVEPNAKPRVFTVVSMTDGDGAAIESAPRPAMTVRIPCDIPLRPGAIIRKKKY